MNCSIKPGILMKNVLEKLQVSLVVIGILPGVFADVSAIIHNNSKQVQECAAAIALVFKA